MSVRVKPTIAQIVEKNHAPGTCNFDTVTWLLYERRVKQPKIQLHWVSAAPKHNPIVVYEFNDGSKLACGPNVCTTRITPHMKLGRYI